MNNAANTTTNTATATAKTVYAKGYTYPARTQLRDAGFDWDKVNKVWFIDADKFDEVEWNRKNNNATYSRANQKACSRVVFAK